MSRVAETLLVYVSDAVAFLYYLLDRLPPNADRAFREAEKGAAELCLPTIAAAELHYLFERKRWREHWLKLKSQMKQFATFSFYPFSENVLDLFDETKAKEIHDKIVVSTAKLLKAEAVITKDGGIRNLGEVKTLW